MLEVKKSKPRHLPCKTAITSFYNLYTVEMFCKVSQEQEEEQQQQLTNSYTTMLEVKNNKVKLIGVSVCTLAEYEWRGRILPERPGPAK